VSLICVVALPHLGTLSPRVATCQWQFGVEGSAPLVQSVGIWPLASVGIHGKALLTSLLLLFCCSFPPLQVAEEPHQLPHLP